MKKKYTRIISMRNDKNTSKKAVIISILTLSLICTAFASMISIVNAKKVNENCKNGFPAGHLWVAYDDDGVPGTWYRVEQQFDVIPGVTYWIKVCDIPWFLGDTILIKVCNEEDWTREVDVKGDERCSEPFAWVCPDADYCTTYVVQYRRLKTCVCQDHIPPCVFVAKGTMCKPAHLHVIPEFAFGPGMSVLAMLTGLAIFMISRRPYLR